MESDILLEDLIDKAKPLYILPMDPVVSEVLIPALKTTQNCDCMMGYFSSKSFAEIAPGLATFLKKNDNQIRLVISPYLTKQDQDAILKGLENPSEIVNSMFSEAFLDADKISKHTLECLSWLIFKKRLVIKIALMKEAIFHTKAWLFKSMGVEVALHGSMNFTNQAFIKNREQLTLSRSWRGEESQYHIKRLRTEFDNLWNNKDSECIVLDLPKAVEKKLIAEYKGEVMPSEQVVIDFWKKIDSKNQHKEETYTKPQSLEIPDYLNYEDGEYAHQGKAVTALLENKGRGILEMATGSGKTITAMIAATKLFRKSEKLLVVVAAPYVPLIEQWCGEIDIFGATPINLVLSSGPNERSKTIKDAIRKLRFGVSNVEVLVVSHDTLSTEEFSNSISYGNVSKLIIADECHNLGTTGFKNNASNVFDYRIGLSATPIRQYDEEGTEFLLKYFGDICFEFKLEDAIGKCLTEYDYHVHFAELKKSEMDDWSDLTKKIASVYWQTKNSENDSYLNDLYRKRRLILETASNKISILEKFISQLDNRKTKYGLIYATDKDPEQLMSVNALLRKNNISFHQLTSEETRNRRKTSEIMQSFQDGNIKILTAKRVLDEGVNIPQIKFAYILASTTVKRQWVQRRGRLLRICKEIGKTHSVIHDFVTLPPVNSNSEIQLDLDEDSKKIVKSELERVWEFARLSRNAPDNNGPFRAVEYLQKLANKF
ncbi:MAG: DEAD/DEAH box helicase family protein [Balneolaceae bacterium]